MGRNFSKFILTFKLYYIIMIFVATNADASGSNLGQISIKTITDVSKETYDLIANYGNKKLSDEQIIALDDFLIEFNLKWKSKINCLILPILCGDRKVYEAKDDFLSSKALYNIKSNNLQSVTASLYSNSVGRLQITDKGFEAVSPIHVNFGITINDLDSLANMNNNNSHCVLVCSKDWCSRFADNNTLSKVPFDTQKQSLSNFSLDKGSGNWKMIDEDKNIYGYSISNPNTGWGYNQGIKLGIENTNQITQVGLVRGHNGQAPGWMAALSFGVGFNTKEDFNNYCDALYNLYNILK